MKEQTETMRYTLLRLFRSENLQDTSTPAGKHGLSPLCAASAILVLLVRCCRLLSIDGTLCLAYERAAGKPCVQGAVGSPCVHQ